MARGAAARKAGRRPRAITLALLLPLLLTGCWDRREIVDLAIVSVVGLDLAKQGGIELTVQLPVPQEIPGPVATGGGSGGGGRSDPRQPPVLLLTSTGRTVQDAADRLQERLSRQLFWAHNVAVVLGEDLARQGILPILDFFTRQRETRLRTLVLVARGRARDVLNAVPRLDVLPSEGIRETVAFRLGPEIDLRDMAQMLIAEGTDPIATLVEVVYPTPLSPPPPDAGGGDPGGGGGQGGPARPGGPGSQGGSRREPPPEPPQPRGQFVGRMRVAGTAVFKGDRLVGFLDDRETRGLLWVRDEVEVGGTTLLAAGQGGRPLPRRPDLIEPPEMIEPDTIIEKRFGRIPDGGYGGVSAFLIRSNTELQPRLEGPDRITIRVKSRFEDDVVENGTYLDLDDPLVIRELERLLSRVVEETIRATVDKVQHELRADVFGFADAVRRKYPREWESRLKTRWDELFPTVRVEYDILGRIRRTGLTGGPSSSAGTSSPPTCPGNDHRRLPLPGYPVCAGRLRAPPAQGQRSPP